MLKTLNQPVTFLVVLGLFIWLSAHSWNYPAHHVDMSEGEFISRKLADYHPPDAGVVYKSGRAPVKTVFVWRDRKTAELAYALSLTPESIDTTVDVRRVP